MVMDKDPDVGGGGEEDHLNKSQKGKGSEAQDECDFYKFQFQVMLAHPRGDVWKQSDTKDRTWVLTCRFEVINKKIKDHILS